MSDDLDVVAAHCPNCGAEYRAGFDTCADCAVALEPGPSPADVRTTAAGQIEVQPEAPAADERVSQDAGEQEEEGHPYDLFEMEEDPVRIVLAVMPQWEAADVVVELERRGIGARLGDSVADGEVEVLVHNTRLGDAQGFLAGYTGEATFIDQDADPGDDESTPGDEQTGGSDENLPTAWAEANRRVWGSGDRSEDPATSTDDDGDQIAVVSTDVLQAHRDAERLAAAGINARVSMYDGGDEAHLSAQVYVSRKDADEARKLLGVVL